MLRRTPVWTAAVSAMLALGIGLSTAIFSVVYGVLLQPLPYPSADRLIAIWPTAAVNGYPRFFVTPALWLAWRIKSTLHDSITPTIPTPTFTLPAAGFPRPPHS